VIRLEQVTRVYPIGGADVRAIDGITLTIPTGEFDEADLEVIRDVVARLGLADVAAFGLIHPFLALFVVTAIF